MVRLGQKVFKEPDKTSSQTSIAHVTDRQGRGHASIGGAFKLVDHKGHRRTDADYRGKYMLVYFGYTFCPDICPTALYNMTQALEKLGTKANEINPVFITIDPQRDTVEQLALYKSNFHPRIAMLTGSMEDVKTVAKAYRVYFAKAQPDGTTSEYLVDHSSIIYVMDRQGRYLTSFNHETPPQDMVNVLSKLM